jgi:uncharacterized protein YnzC (UPF0291/DUF896 family)
MKTKGATIGIIIALALVVSLAGLPALAQDKPADNMQIVRDKIKADKKLFVAEVMNLTDSEAKGFWPVYDSYQKDLGKIHDKSIALINEYAKNYQSMTNELAKKLTDDFVAIQADHQKLRESYLPQFRKVLPEMKVARYYQIENKIGAVVDYELATNIPFVK